MAGNQYDPYGQFGTRDDMLPPHQRPGTSTGTKVLACLGVVFLILVVLCCTGTLFSTCLLQRYAKKSFSDDPVKIEEIRSEIADLDVPEGLVPKGGVDFRVPFAQTRVMAMAAYVDEEHDSALILMTMGDAFQGQEVEMRRQLEDSFDEREMGEQEEIDVEDVYEKQFTINGQPATFEIAKGKGKKSGENRLQATGTFQGKTGPAMLLLNVEADTYSEDDVLKLLESIK